MTKPGLGSIPDHPGLELFLLVSCKSAVPETGEVNSHKETAKAVHGRSQENGVKERSVLRTRRMSDERAVSNVYLTSRCSNPVLLRQR